MLRGVMKAGGRTDERGGFGWVLKGAEQEMLTLDGNHVFRAHSGGPSACLPSHSLVLASRWLLPGQQTLPSLPSNQPYDHLSQPPSVLLILFLDFH
jgi:hypothetical protein